MSIAGRKTDERLRTWLTSQADQERLCAGLIAVLGGYTNITPRRPMGGPDGGRDIQAIGVSTRQPVWFSVGFARPAIDTSAARRKMINKCKKDIDAARKENGALRAFGFFTNVDLKPSEEEALRNYASTKGIDEFQAYNRERMRGLLDSPVGYGLRLEFLDIGMGKEQQLAWLSTHHSRLERLETIATHMERLLEGQEPLRSLVAFAEFREGFNLAAHGPFALSVQLASLAKDGLDYRVGFAFQDKGATASKLAWRSPRSGDAGSGSFATDELLTGASQLTAPAFVRGDIAYVLKEAGASIVRDLISLAAVIHVSEGLEPNIAAIGLRANNTPVLTARREQWKSARTERGVHWPPWNGWQRDGWVCLEPTYLSLLNPTVAAYGGWPLMM